MESSAILKPTLQSCQQFNNIHIHFQNTTATCHGQVAQDDVSSIKTLLTPIKKLSHKITRCAKKELQDVKPLYRIDNISGVINPGTMTLILSNPGGGSSTLLRTLANTITPDDPNSVRYNGKTAADLKETYNIDIHKAIQYIDQVDSHLGLLTVQETLSFANSTTSLQPDPAHVDNIINSLSLRQCRDTFVGSPSTQTGVSGGERRRLFLAQAMLSDAAVLCLDQYTQGLDASTAFEITKQLQSWCTSTGGSVVATILQPTPEIYGLFDQLILLSDGKCLFNGPPCDVNAFFNAMGYFQPHDIDLCDYLLNVLVSPKWALHFERQYLRVNKDNDKVKTFLDLQQCSSGELAKLSTSLGNITCLLTPALTINSMRDFYQSSPQYASLKLQCDNMFQMCDDNDLDNDNITPKLFAPEDIIQKRFATGCRQSFHFLLYLLIQREARIALRSFNILIPRLIQVIVLGILYGGVFWMVDDDDFFKRMSIVLVALTQVGYNNVIEIPTNFESNYIIYNQIASSFYPAWAYVIASFVNSIPQVLLECTIFSVIIYFMTGAALYVSAFFLFLLIVVLQSLMLCVAFRLITSLSSSLSVAATFSQIIISLATVFAGFFLSFSNVPSWLLWMYWCLPFSWSTRATMIIEYQQPKYDQIITIPVDVFDPSRGMTDVRRGDLYLEYADMFYGYQWVIYGFVYLAVVTVLCLILQSFVYSYRKKFFETRGTPRAQAANQLGSIICDDPYESGTSDEENVILPSKNRIIRDAQVAAIDDRNGLLSSHELANLSFQLDTTLLKENLALDSEPPPPPELLSTLQHHFPVIPTCLSFHNLKYTIKVKDSDNGGVKERVLLDNVNGYVEPNKMLALVGASGCGKTTLLSILAGIQTAGTIEGKILLNGQPATHTSISLVEQFDTLHPYQTVFETLRFAAFLRLPVDIDDEIKIKAVEEIIDVLELSNVRDRLIGNHLNPSLSPSQCKLVSIGVELVANPSILLLDEPLSAQNSTSTAQVMRVIKKLSKTRTVIVCLHQPSTEVFYLFDRMILLAPGGKQVFCGDLGMRSSFFINYFNQCPGIIPFSCGNPATWLIQSTVRICHTEEEHVEYLEFLSQLSQHFYASTHYLNLQEKLTILLQTCAGYTSIETTSQDSSNTIIDHTDSSNPSPTFEDDNSINLQSDLEFTPPDEINSSANKPSNTVEFAPFALLKPISPPIGTLKLAARDDDKNNFTPRLKNTISRPSAFKQFKLLFIRNHSSYWRNPSFLFGRLLTCFLLSIVFGLIFQSIQSNSKAGALALISAGGVVVYFASTVHCASLPMFETRQLFYRETSAGLYYAGLWSLCSLLNELIWILPASILAVAPLYWMVGYPANPGTFFICLLASYLCIVSYVSTTIAIASCSKTPTLASIGSSAFVGLSFLYSGFTITLPQLQQGWHWLVYMFPLSHCLHAILPLFENDTRLIVVLDSNNQPTSISIANFISSYLGMEFGRTWQHVGWLLLYIASLQLISFLGIIFLQSRSPRSNC